ncbi:hypothetical protein P3T76_008928 [Phytophthora citrophthora]|uniref:Uncharacterized protein n=1 Tax=Phytophthora citrophthora TaxID=4793 RepID=A0AAD9GIM3_9STRA|nr:hypothetical protein P3T76_008928 [Phytophthora citrophthora]
MTEARPENRATLDAKTKLGASGSSSKLRPTAKEFVFNSAAPVWTPSAVASPVSSPAPAPAVAPAAPAPAAASPAPAAASPAPAKKSALKTSAKPFVPSCNEHTCLLKR